MKVSEYLPFVIKMQPRKKQKVDKSKGIVLLVLTDGDTDEIAKKFKRSTQRPGIILMITAKRSWLRCNRASWR